MKLKWYIIPLFALLIASCGTEGLKSKKDLKLLKSKRDSLRTALTKVEEEIRGSDTTMSYPKVGITRPERKTFEHYFTVSASVESDKNALIHSEAGGVIKIIRVAEGDKVFKGQPLVEVDNSILVRNIDELKTQRDLAKTLYEKQQSLRDKEIGSEVDYLRAKSNYEALNKKLQTLQTQKGKTVIRAPFSGYVESIFSKVGEIAGPMSPVLRIINVDKVKLSADISERYAHIIKKGEKVIVNLPDVENFEAIEAKIDVKGMYVNPINRTIKVQSFLDNPTGNFLPNLVAEMKILDLKKDSVFVVPNKVIQQDNKGKDFILIVEKEKGSDYPKTKKVYVSPVKSYNGVTWVREAAELFIPGKTRKESTTKKIRLSEDMEIISVGVRGVKPNEYVKVENLK